MPRRVKGTGLVMLMAGFCACESPTAAISPADGGENGPGPVAEDASAAGPDGGSTQRPDGGEPARPTKTTPMPLTQTEGFYPRVIQREDGTIVASILRRLPERMGATFFESTDGGLSFTEIGAIDDPANDTGLCCGTLFELPRQLGAMAKGTLLWSASRGGDGSGPMSIPIWKSDDGGRNWISLATVVTAGVPRNEGGLWEPELAMTDDGMLVCHWSDETDPSHSQKLMQARSSDGVTWKNHTATVSLSNAGYRPGMPNVRRPPGGPFVLSYEICALENDHCTAFFRTSNDGWNWGDVTSLGTRPTTPDGKHFRHAPTLAWSASPGANGRFYLVGQMVHDAGGNVASENGRILLANTEGGHGYWYPIAAPVPVPSAYDNFCPNYSSSVIPLENGTVALEIASQWDGATCRPYFARSPLIDTSDSSEIESGQTFRVVSLISGHCLDVANGSTATGGNVQQATCNGTNAQRWTVSRASDGSLSLRAAVSDMCLTVAGNASTPGANVEQAPCGGAGQAWTLRAVGVGYYELVKAGASVCLDVASGSTASGANVAQWTCNDLAPQIWRFDRL